MWFILDGLGIALGLLTWGLLAFADWVVLRHVLLAWFWTPRPRISWLPLTDLGAIVALAYQLLLFLAWYSHFSAMTTDPGTIRQSTAPAHFEQGALACTRLRAGPAREVTCRLCHDRWKPPRAHHCKTCHRCIFRMDHHCPWINNCVGLANQKLFVLFLGYTALSAIVTLILLVTSAIVWLWSQKSWSDAAPPGSAALICSGLVAVECLAAVLFVGDFLWEQIESIQMNSTLVETYQRTHGARSTFLEHFMAVFGRRWWHWPWPYASFEFPDYTEPAIPDEGDIGIPCRLDSSDTHSLGIAGEESVTSAGELDKRYEALAEGLRQRLDRAGGNDE